MGMGKDVIKLDVRPKYGIIYNQTKEKCDDCGCPAFYGYRVLPDLKTYYYKCEKCFVNIK